MGAASPLVQRIGPGLHHHPIRRDGAELAFAGHRDRLTRWTEQALGVGTGSLRSHGNQIQTMSKTISRRAR